MVHHFVIHIPDSIHATGYPDEYLLNYRQKPVNKWTTSSDDSTTRHSFPHTNGSHISTMALSHFPIESHPLYLKSTVCSGPLAVADVSFSPPETLIPQREPYRSCQLKIWSDHLTRTGIPVLSLLHYFSGYTGTGNPSHRISLRLPSDELFVHSPVL